MSKISHCLNETADRIEKLTPDPRITNLIGEEGRQRFYLIRTKKLGNISLLQYIVENAPMAKQREELLDLLAKKIECVYEKKYNGKTRWISDIDKVEINCEKYNKTL